MKYSARRDWTVDMSIVSEDALSSAQVIWCTRKLYEAVTANGNAAGVKPYIGDEHFHAIEIWADKNCDWGLFLQLITEMCRQGCRVEMIGDDVKKMDYLMNLGRYLSRVN